MRITVEVLKKIAPRASRYRLEVLAASAHEMLWKYNITSRTHLVHFFAQVAHESGDFNVDRENSNYSAKNLGDMWDRGTWRRYFTDRASMVAMAGRGRDLFNIVYGNRMGNGPAASGDGYRYRGGGLPQITGKDGYAAMQAITGVPFVANPDLVCNNEHLLEVACAFWRWKRMDQVATARTDAALVAVTKRWNGGDIGLAERRKKFAVALKVITEDLDPLVAPIALVTPAGNDQPKNEINEDREPEHFVPNTTPPTPAGYAPALVIDVKTKLQKLGYHEFGMLDAEWGGRTVAAIAAYKTDRGLGGEPAIDDALVIQLNNDVAAGWYRPIVGSRSTASAETMANNPTIKSNWWAKLTAKVSAGFGAIGAAISGIWDKFPDVRETYIDPFMYYFTFIPIWGWFLIGVGIACLVWFFTRKSDQATVAAYRDGRLL